MEPGEARRNCTLLAIGVATGASYGLFIRWGAQLLPRGQALIVMSVGFLFFLPFAVGFISVYVVERRQPQSVLMWLALSSMAVLAGLAGTILALWEGLICVVMFAPIGLACGMIGGVTAGFLLRSRRKRLTTVPLACVMVLPLLITPWEHQVLAVSDVRTVESTTDIHASSDVVWQNIERVSRIGPEELQPSWSHRIGFPNPVEATLSFEGNGGVRHASFEGGVMFTETVDTWEPSHRLAFSIHPETMQIPPTTLDEHVTVGGPFFDVLRGEYVLEPLSNGIIRLHLTSRHRVSTDFNWYAHLWTDAVMTDIQKKILRVIRNRCETTSLSPSSN